MQIVVASKNPVKINATRAAFTALLPDATFNVIGITVDSGVSDQPRTDAETRRGARNRAANAASAEASADYYVGLEGGLEVTDGILLAFAWIAIQNSAGVVSFARSATLPLPNSIRELIDAGLELGDANDRVFATKNSKQGGGAYGLLTGGLLTRESIYTETAMLALLPFTNEQFQ